MSAIFLPGDVLLHYEVLGRGRPPVLFLHSWVGSWRYWLLSMEEVALLPQRAYAVDLPGFGGSVSLRNEEPRFDPDRALEAILHFLNELGVVQVVVVGHGLGALMALYLLARHPERVSRLLTVSLPWDTGLLERWGAVSPQVLAGHLLTDLTTEELQVAYKEASKTPEGPYRQAMAWARDFWKQVALPSVAVPWLLLYGAQDPLAAPPQNLDALPAGENRHMVVLPETGHFPMLEYPRRFHRVLKAFLTAPAEAPLSDLALKEEWQRRVR